MLETVAVVLGIVHAITMLIFVPVWNVLAKLNKSIGGVKDALQDLKLHISEKYSTKETFTALKGSVRRLCSAPMKGSTR